MADVTESDEVNWRRRVDAFWDSMDDAAEVGSIERMRALVAERPEGDAEALFEWASVHDSIGREREAVGHYRAALDAGLSGPLRAQAQIQLGSSLRNLGAFEESVRVLRSAEADESVGDAAQAFLALALHDRGQHADALRAALTALAPTLPRYRRSVRVYADALGTQRATERIRAVAVGLVVREDHALVGIYPASPQHPLFARALGGGIDFGEPADAGVRREFAEELGVTVSGVRLLGVSENIFDTGAKRGHEIVHAFAVHSAELDAMDLDQTIPVADSHTTARWVPIAALEAEDPPLYPPGIIDLIRALRES